MTSSAGHDRTGASQFLFDGAQDVDPTSRDQVEIASDGRFVLEGIFGERALRVIGLPSGWGLAGVEYRGRPQTTFTIGPGAWIDDLVVVVAAW